MRGDRLLVAIPLPRELTLGDPYVFPATDGPVDYAAPQNFRRSGNILVAELARKRGEPAEFSGVLALGDGRGLEFTARPGIVPDGGTPVGSLGANVVLAAILGALLGGILLNLMPCVFPILALKALHLARGGGEEGEARRDALAYAAGAIVGTGALGAVLLAVRAGGSAAGWAFQLQEPRMILVLMLLAIGITLNLLGLFTVPAFGGRARPTGGFATGALAAFVATPCAGPFLGAALGTALLLPPIGSLLVFAALGLGLAIPFVAVAFIPALRSRLPKPGPWMERLQRYLAIPMGATAVACLWLLWRVGGPTALEVGLVAAAVLAVCLIGAGLLQRKGQQSGYWAAMAAVAVAVLAVSAIPQRAAISERTVEGAEPWSEAAVAYSLRQGHPVFVYFTADWCLTCKANEAAAIDRDAVREAFRERGVRVLAGDWTNGDPAITRFLDSRGRAGVPLYLWIEPGKPPEELPQILTPGDAHFPRSAGALAGRCQTFLPATQVSRTCVAASSVGDAVGYIPVDEDEVGPFAWIERAEPVLGESGISRARACMPAAPGRGVTRSCGRQPPGGWPSASWRLTAAARPGNGLGDSNGKSTAEREPRAVAESSARHKRRRARLGPEPRFGHQPVADLVGRLHRGDDPGLGDARDVGRDRRPGHARSASGGRP